MKKIVFFGAPDKSHLLLVLGKLLTALEQKVLIVDSTLAQSMQGYLPQVEFGYSLREFEGIDVATGLLTSAQLERSVLQSAGEAAYDVMLLDTDHTEFVKGRDLPGYDKRVWCSNYSRLGMQINASLMQRLCLHEAEGQPLTFYKLITPTLPTAIPESYIDSLLPHQTVRWEETVFRFPLDERNLSVELDNQHHGRIDIRRLSGTYRRTVLDMLQQLFDCDAKTARQAWARSRKRA
ncbi:hypothetical protein P9314_02935 [Paenibacillus validus]|uniref:hypothetical protein n=1 Tax=Paenibacillus TaxID=44249 RepID=UPI000FDC1831|nr:MULTISPECIES: hypothetical protein [Paenibacillus]MED4599659.1 hypothetical protein [Paenibacillus validus]MED4604577.1 hypothetical protein [Paenibacillus validus]NTZ19124.1 hypothetical protein [Paenibacillus sp. JMULE4]